MPDSKPWARTLRWLRLALFVIVTIVAVFVLLLAIHRGLLPLVALALPSLETTFYDLAVYGVYRTRDFVSFDIPAPRVNTVLWHESCDDGSNILLAPYGDSVKVPGPVMLDARGDLVWYMDEFDEVTNFQMQTYRGKKYLTFWAGHKVGGVGQGALYMLDETYRVTHKVRAVGDNLKGDLHEFSITDRGTAVITVYNRTNFDLRPMGLFRGADGWISDCIFQEVDIATGELLFQWAASEHLRPERTYYTQPFGGFHPTIPYDYFHLNSVQRDTRGNFLISSRHFHTISYISGTTGEILWELGGDSTDFTDLSSGAATDFKWQHHARWYDEEAGLLTLFDNGVAGPLHVDHPTSKATLLHLDLENMTAEHVHSYYPNHNVLSSSQGSVQVLPGGDRLFTGWGSSGMWTEHHIEGSLLCEVHFGASIVYAWEWVKSYRVFKAWGWVGRPAHPPDARILGTRLFVSWNGATEVARWQLEGRRIDAQEVEDFEVIAGLDKHSFEESFPLPTTTLHRRYRVRALDADRNTLGFSNLVDPVDVEKEGSIGLVFGILAGALVFLGAVWILRRRTRRRGPLIGTGGIFSASDSGSGSSGIGGNFLRYCITAWEKQDLLRWTGVQYRYSKL